MRGNSLKCQGRAVTDLVDTATQATTTATADSYERALASVKRNDMPAALRAIQEALANHDARCNVHNLAGLILKSLNVPHLVSASVPMFERSLELWPNHTIARENLSHARSLLGRSDPATARRSHDNHDNLHLEVEPRTPARSLVQRNDNATALLQVDATARKHAEMQLEVGEAHLQLDHLELAAEAFAAAIRADGCNLRAHQKLTSTLLELRWFYNALAAAHHGLTVCVATVGAGTDSLIAAQGLATQALQAKGKVLPPNTESIEFAILCDEEWRLR